MSAVLPVVLAAAAATAVLFGIKRMMARPGVAEPDDQKPTFGDAPMAFIAFIMFIALFHWLGVGGTSPVTGGARLAPDAYEDTMIANIPEDCFTGQAPF
jgi:hypothetical protein